MDYSVLDMHPGLIIGFAVTVIIMLLLDLGIFNKKSHVVSNKEAITWSIVWVSLAMAFSGVIYYVFNHLQKVKESKSKEIDKMSIEDL